MMKKRIYQVGFLLIFFICVLSQYSIAQTMVKGSVSEANGDPLIGASVTIKGKLTGTVTDINGNYSISVENSDAVLVFSYIGFTTKEEKVGSRQKIDVQLSASTEGIDEVVVVGYGTQKRQSVTGAVAQVSGEELLKAPVGNITSKLGGLVSGVVSLQQSGQPGADGASILVRGSEAKYIVDGIERSFSEIDPNEIATV
ncbi:MAG: carboxypeptidase-like regulatory domain-containing protein, partial [Draconibacterium sp.]